MPDYFSNFSIQQKNAAYEQLCMNIKNGELDQIQKNSCQKIDLAYKLPDGSQTESGSIDTYSNSPIGLALFSKDQNAKKILLSLLENMEFNNLALHISNYFLLAAKSNKELSVIFVQELFDLCFKQGIFIDLSIGVNQSILDKSIKGTKDFFEIALEHNNDVLIKWILQKKYIQTKIFEPKIKHLQCAIKTLSNKIVDDLLLNSSFSLLDLKTGLEEQFFCITKKVSYWDYVQGFNLEVYHKICKYLLHRIHKEFNEEVFSWLLSKGIDVTVGNTLFLKLHFQSIQTKHSIEELLKISIDFTNEGLLRELLLENKVSIRDVIKHIKDRKLNINLKLFEILYENLKDLLLQEEDFPLLLDFIFLVEQTLHRKFWCLLNLATDDHFVKIIDYYIEKNLKFLVLDSFLSFVSEGRISIVSKFLKSKYKVYLLNGSSERTALSIACEYHHLEMAKFLIPQLNANQINKIITKSDCYENITALWLSIALEHVDTVNLLLSFPEIEINTGKGWHHKIRASAALTCKELDPGCEYIDLSKEKLFVPCFNSIGIGTNYIEGSTLIKNHTNDLSVNSESSCENQFLEYRHQIQL